MSWRMRQSQDTAQAQHSCAFLATNLVHPSYYVTTFSLASSLKVVALCGWLAADALDIDGNGHLSVDEFMAQSMWERTCVEKGVRMMTRAQNLNLAVDNGASRECWIMIVGSHTSVGDIEHVDDPQDHFNVRIELSFTYDLDQTFSEEDHCVPIDDCVLGKSENDKGQRSMVMTVSAEQFPNHVLAGKLLTFSSRSMKNTIMRKTIDDLIAAINEGKGQNNALDKLTLGRFAPGAKYAIASFPGEDRHLWSLLIRGLPSRIARAFDGEPTVTLCPIFTYKFLDQWFEMWQNNIHNAVKHGQKLLVYTVRNFINRKEPKDDVKTAEENRSFPGRARNIKKDDPLRKFGFSQQREVEWLEENNYPFEERPVEDIDEMRSVDGEGNVYHGEWSVDESSCSRVPGGRPGIRQGFGTEVRVDGRIYSGWWKEDRPNGRGEEWKDGEWHYVGEFVDGWHHGKGVFTFLSGKEAGRIMNGEFRRDVFVSGRYLTNTGAGSLSQGAGGMRLGRKHAPSHGSSKILTQAGGNQQHASGLAQAVRLGGVSSAAVTRPLLIVRPRSFKRACTSSTIRILASCAVLACTAVILTAACMCVLKCASDNVGWYRRWQELCSRSCLRRARHFPGAPAYCFCRRRRFDRVDTRVSSRGRCGRRGKEGRLHEVSRRRERITGTCHGIGDGTETKYLRRMDPTEEFAEVFSGRGLGGHPVKYCDREILRRGLSTGLLQGYRRYLAECSQARANDP